MSKPQAPRATIQGIYDQTEWPFRRISYPTEEYSLEGRRLRDIVESYLITHIAQEKHINRLHIVLTKEDYGWPHVDTYF